MNQFRLMLMIVKDKKWRNGRLRELIDSTLKNGIVDRNLTDLATDSDKNNKEWEEYIKKAGE